MLLTGDQVKTLPLPHEARCRRGTYTVDIFYDIKYRIIKETKNGPEIQEMDFEQVLFCSLPIMVKSNICSLTLLGREPEYSKECTYDAGGYFLINGNEKILVDQEEMRQNQPLVFLKPSAGNKNYIVTEVRSYPDSSISSPVLILVKYKNYKNNNFKGVGNKGNFSKTIRVKMPFLKKDIPVGIIFMALGFRTDKDILESIMTDMNDKEMIDALSPSIEESKGMVTNIDGALQYLLTKVADLGDTQIRGNEQQRIINLLNNDLFPHVGMDPHSWKRKGLFLGECIYRLMCVALKRRDPDDRDHYTNKRVYGAGALIYSLYCKLIKLVKKEVKSGLQKLVNDGKPISASSLFLKKTTQKLMYAFATGHWTVVKVGHMGKTGVSMGRQMMSIMSVRSYMARLNTPIGREAKLILPRLLTSAQLHRVCVTETPEGNGCGLVKNAALLCYISMPQKSNQWIIELLLRYGTRKLDECDFNFRKKSFKVFVNGLWIGNNENGKELVDRLRKLRRSMDIHFETGIIYDPWSTSVRVYTDGGRVLTPYLIVENGEIKLTKKRIKELNGIKSSLSQTTFI
jgi:DNA-directed RNA polymerase II subunit RPB2